MKDLLILGLNSMENRYLFDIWKCDKNFKLIYVLRPLSKDPSQVGSLE